MKKLLLITVVSGITLFSCKTQKKEINANMDNPFFTEWTTPFGVPPFDDIKDEHYVPAIEEGIKQQQAEIDAIVPIPKNQLLPIQFWRSINRVSYSTR